MPPEIPPTPKAMPTTRAAPPPARPAAKALPESPAPPSEVSVRPEVNPRPVVLTPRPPAVPPPTWPAPAPYRRGRVQISTNGWKKWGLTAQGKESQLALGWLRDSARPPNETQFVAALGEAGVTPDLVINCLELARDPADRTDHLGLADEVFLRINESIGREIWASVANMLNEKRDVDRTIHIYCKSGRHRSLAEFYCRVSLADYL